MFLTRTWRVGRIVALHGHRDMNIGQALHVYSNVAALMCKRALRMPFQQRYLFAEPVQRHGGHKDPPEYGEVADGLHLLVARGGHGGGDVLYRAQVALHRAYA